MSGNTAQAAAATHAPEPAVGLNLNRMARRGLGAACVGFAILAVSSWLFAAFALVDDAYGVDHVGGTWLGLAQLAGHGTLYPPIYDGHFLGGTRYMPLPILLHGGLGALLGDYLVAGKLIVYTLTIALLVVVALLLRLSRCPLPIAALLIATLLVSGTGVTTSIWLHHDTLPVILQLVAVGLIAHSTRRKALVGAGVLSALALVAKLSAIWAPLAIGLWLLTRERSRLPVFATSFLGTALVLFGTFEAVTRGRLGDNIVHFGLSTSRSESLAREVSRIRLIFGEGLGPLRLLLVLALVVVAGNLWRRRLTVYHVSLLVSLPVLAVVLADPGTSWNQLLDLQVLSVVVVGGAWPRLRPLFRTGLTLVVLAAAILSYVEKSLPPVETASNAVAHGTSRLPEIARGLSPNMQLLSEDPYVPISLGQRPVVLDAYMLWAIAHRRPEARDDLVQRIDAREFDAVILFNRPEDRSTSGVVRFWYEKISFGPEIVDAIERNYRAAAEVDGRWIYTPRPRSGATATAAGAKSFQRRISEGLLTAPTEGADNANRISGMRRRGSS